MLIAAALMTMLSGQVGSDSERIVITKARSAATGEPIAQRPQPAVPNADGSFPPPPKGLPRPAWPETSPGLWVSMSDYPAAALREERQGTTRFLATVDTSGRVSACVITVSSGSPVLDEVTCNLVTARARFKPAVDSRGKPTIGSYQNAIRWVIPKFGPRAGPKAGELVTSMVVNEDGTVTECRVERASVDPEVSAIAARSCPANMLPYRDASGNPAKRRLVTTIRIEVEPVE